MANTQDQPQADQPTDGGKPPRSRLRQILDEKPEARPRLGKAIAALLGTALVTMAAMGALLIWHIKRRTALMRERLNLPRSAQPLDLPGQEVDSTS